MNSVGLTLGKYAPLHKGHQYIIETALSEVDELFVIIYDTAVTNIPLKTRADWIRNLYPEVKVIEATGGPTGLPGDAEYERQEEKYIKNILKGQKITHFFSSEYYGEHMSIALGAIDRRIDPNREKYPVSSTIIRENPYKYRKYLDDIVYWDCVIKVVILGAMSTGKSTITEALATKYNTTFVPEYGREYWETHQVNRRLSLKELDEIARGHQEKELEAVKAANQYCFIDTNAITTYLFAMDYHGVSTPYLNQLASENRDRYDLCFLCDDDIPYEDTWDRSGNQKRTVFQKQTIEELRSRGVTYYLLSGDLKTRVGKADEILSQYHGK